MNYINLQKIEIIGKTIITDSIYFWGFLGRSHSFSLIGILCLTTMYNVTIDTFNSLITNTFWDRIKKSGNVRRYVSLQQLFLYCIFVWAVLLLYRVSSIYNFNIDMKIITKNIRRNIALMYTIFHSYRNYNH